MKFLLELDQRTYSIDTAAGRDISMPFSPDPSSSSAWYVNPVEIEVVRSGGYIGSVEEGGSTNFRNIKFNPHGNGTHTECVGHISKTVYSINMTLREYFFPAVLISVEPTEVQIETEISKKGDRVITPEHFKGKLEKGSTKALVIRTIPNEKAKLKRNYSNSNPPYLLPETIHYLLEMGIEHLLIDLPSVDRENDEGKLLSHHAFWNYPANTAFERTITEMIFVADDIPDGKYLLNLMVAPFENDASPSKPILYPLNLK